MNPSIMYLTIIMLLLVNVVHTMMETSEEGVKMSIARSIEQINKFLYGELGYALDAQFAEIASIKAQLERMNERMLELEANLPSNYE